MFSFWEIETDIQYLILLDLPLITEKIIGGFNYKQK